MNYISPPKSEVTNALLLDVARRVQLSPTDYRLAIQHYQAIDKHLRRGESPLRNYVMRLYPQGGMAIGAVISSKFDHDEFDIDVVLELNIIMTCEPAAVLDWLFDALNGPPGSLYYGKVKRRTRCVTVDYDGMHVDITPAILLHQLPARTSIIFHANERDPKSQHRQVLANPWGFANWFEERMPSARFFAEAVLRKTAEPVPAQIELEAKALPLIALQLIKRNRNKVFEPRLAKGQVKRVPPSVLLSYYTAILGGVRTTLLDELREQTQYILDIFNWHNKRGTLLDVRNPACNEDKLSDRWPASLDEQRLFANDLSFLAEEVAKLSDGVALPEAERIMSNLFGEHPTKAAFEDFAKRFGAAAASSRLFHHLGSGAVALGASGLAAGSKALAPAVATPRTTNFGSE